MPSTRSVSFLTLAALLATCSCGDSTAPPYGGGPPVLTTILLVAPTGTIVVGATSQLTATPMDQYGNAFNATVTWSSSNGGVAIVSGAGLVRAVAVGTAVISATAGSVSAPPLVITVIASGGTYPLTADVVMSGYQFLPTFTDIQRTGTVRFVFPSLPHNVIFSTGVAGTPANIDILANTTVSRTFSTAGTFNFSCTVHPGMVGAIIVH